MGNKISNRKSLLQLIKRRSKVHQRHMPREGGLSFDQWKTFTENYEPVRAWLWLVYKIAENKCSWRLFARFIQSYKRYHTSLDKISRRLKFNTCHTKLKFFLSTKLFEKLLLAKYLVSVVATLNRIWANLIVVFFTFDRKTWKWLTLLLLLTFHMIRPEWCDNLGTFFLFPSSINYDSCLIKVTH